MGTKIKGILQPKITISGAPGFLLWARRDAPPLYAALVREFREVAEFDEALRADDVPGGVSGFMDIIGTVGSGLVKAFGSIGSFVGNNASSIFSAAGGYLMARQQSRVAEAQIRLAQASQPPAQTAYVTNEQGQVVPVPVQPAGSGYASYYNPPGGQSGVMATLANVPLTTWLLGAGALAGVMLLIKRR